MGGGVAMRAAAKVAGINVLNTGLRGTEHPVVSAARQATRSVSSVSSDELKLTLNDVKNNNSSSVEKGCVYDDDWDFTDVADDVFVGESSTGIPRLVFGGVPSFHEAKQATSDLNLALQKTYLHPNASHSDSEHVEIKPCLVSEKLVTPSAPRHAIKAFRLLNENPKAQLCSRYEKLETKIQFVSKPTAVASIASDPNVWNAVLQNPELVDFLQTHKTEFVFPEKDPTDETPKANESSGKGFMDYVEDIKQSITVTVIDMVNSLSNTFQTLFGGSLDKGGVIVNRDGTAGISAESAAIGASLMGLAIMVIAMVALKRS